MQISAVLNNIAIIKRIQGEIEKSLELYNKSLEIRKKIGNQKLIASNYNNIGNIWQIKGDLDKSIDWLRDNLIGKTVSITDINGDVISSGIKVYDITNSTISTNSTTEHIRNILIKGGDGSFFDINKNDNGFIVFILDKIKIID